MLEKNTIKRKKLEPELINKNVGKKDFKPVPYKRHDLGFLRKVRVYIYLFKRLKDPAFSFFWNNKRLTLSLIGTFMKIKTNQTSTRAGIMLLATILGLLGVQVDSDLLTSNLETLIQGSIAVVGSATALWAIFKDDEAEEEPEDEEVQ